MYIYIFFSVVIKTGKATWSWFNLLNQWGQARLHYDNKRLQNLSALEQQRCASASTARLLSQLRLCITVLTVGPRLTRQPHLEHCLLPVDSYGTLEDLAPETKCLTFFPESTDQNMAGGLAIAMRGLGRPRHHVSERGGHLNSWWRVRMTTKLKEVLLTLIPSANIY